MTAGRIATALIGTGFFSRDVYVKLFRSGFMSVASVCPGSPGRVLATALTSRNDFPDRQYTSSLSLRWAWSRTQASSDEYAGLCAE
jgi:hypothetical protein